MKRRKTLPPGTCEEKGKELQVQYEGDDRLSSLPDPILVSILSLLPVEKAASTSVLSHHWRYLWTQISRVDLRNLATRRWMRIETDVVSYVSTDHIFAQLTSKNCDCILLKVPPILGNVTQLIQLFESALLKWVGHFCALKVEEIHVRCGVWGDMVPILNLPTCTFLFKSLVVLEIGSGFRFKLPDDGIILPNLNKLLLRYLSEWDSETMSMLFKSCPVLEVLDISIDCKGEGQPIVDVSCQNLRSLKIVVWDVHKGWNYIVNAPKLVVFDVDGLVSSFRFVENPRLLTKAEIQLSKSVDVGVGYIEKLTPLFQGIHSVESLHLSSITLYPLIHLDGRVVPSFHNLSELHIVLNDTSVCNNVLSCLNSTPNLKTLFIKRVFREKGVKWDVPDLVPLCLSHKIEKIVVTQIEGSKEELKFLTYILGNANVLKSIFVGVSSTVTTQVGKEARFCMDLFSSRRVSKACVIDFRGFFFGKNELKTLTRK